MCVHLCAQIRELLAAAQGLNLTFDHEQPLPGGWCQLAFPAGRVCPTCMLERALVHSLSLRLATCLAHTARPAVITLSAEMDTAQVVDQQIERPAQPVTFVELPMGAVGGDDEAMEE